MSFSTLQIPSFQVSVTQIPLIPKSIHSHQEKLQGLMTELSSALDRMDESQNSGKPSFLVMSEAARIRDIGQEAREQIESLDRLKPRIYEDGNEQKSSVRRYRLELSRLLLKFERKMTSFQIPKTDQNPIPDSVPSTSMVSQAVFYPGDFQRERETEIRRINECMEQIHLMLREFSRAVSDQGKVLTELEEGVGKVAENAEKGTDEFEKANEKQGGLVSGWKLGILLLLVLFLALAIAILLLG